MSNLRQKQILIVEDNIINREMLKEILSDEYTIIEAENGQEGLYILKQCKDTISLILLDVVMPVMDGYTFLERKKKDPELAPIPVIITTQRDSEVDEVDALAHGATDFVAKPYRAQIILHRIASIINLRETAIMANQFQYDRLTGLYSKEYFYQKARELLLQNPDQEYDIVSFNIENFKLFNDSFGVPAGDSLLCEIADYFRDSITEQGICSRFNADRFVCLIERGLEYSNDMFAPFNEQIYLLPNAKNLIIKWGVYEISDRSVPVEQMCDRVLLAADSIKGQYNKCFAIYDDKLRDKLLREQAIADDMENALEEGQFIVYIQPKYRLSDDKLAGAEALVRWIHPEWGFISPGEFIPLFEKNGFITRMDQYVWEQACALIRSWKDKGYSLVPVSVNVSRADVFQIDLVDELVKLVEKYEITPSYLHLEVTESVYTENPAKIISTINELRKKGFVIEMDDFGNGYSSLNMLNQMKLDIIKLDMNFIQSETAKPVNQGILRFVVELAHWMNLGVVAEGVETREQLERLREMGCDFVQGYLFAKPMAADEFEKMLKNQAENRYEEHEDVHVDEHHATSLLIVDEDPEYRQMVRQTFGEDYQILEAVDAQEALTFISNQNGSISVIILSMTLPENGGVSLLKNLGEDQASWRTPVLATGPSDIELEMRAFQLDADDYACKPHTPYSIQKRISRMLRIMTYHERERQLRDEVCRDYLTGLLNRRGFHVAINSLKREDLPLALFFFDLDNLKKTNDTYGHELGDQIIQMFGELLNKHTRDVDFVVRYGGDEFVVIMKRVPSREFLLKKGQEICNAAGNCYVEEDVSIACSAGVSFCSVEERPSVKHLRQADQALYRAKLSNKGGCCLWDESMESEENYNS